MSLHKSKLSKAASIFGMIAIVVASFAYALTTAKAAEYDYQWVSQSDYPTLAQGESKTLSLAIRNSGTATWYNTGEHPVHLGTIRPTDRNSGFYTSSQWIATNRVATLNEASVAPGGVGTFTFSITAAPAPGTYPEYFAPVVENITWLQDLGIYWNITVTPGSAATSGYSAELVSKTADPTIAAGDIATLNVTVKNNGTATWGNSGAYPIHVGTWGPQDRSSDFYDSTWLSTNRPVGLNESSVAPGAQGTFNFNVHVPTGKTAGSYTETFNLVAENLSGGWFNLPITFNVNVSGTSSGQVSVSLASDTPTGVTLPKGATAVEMAKFKFVGTGTVNSLKLHRYGVGEASAFANVYLYEGDKRLTNGRSISSSSQMAEFSNLNWSVSGTKYLTVVVDITSDATDAKGQHGFEIVSSSDVSLASVGGSFPIKGELFAIGDSTASQVVVNSQSNPSNPNVGEHAELAKFKITAGGNNIVLHRITLLQSGTVSNSDLSNLELYQGSTLLASEDSLDGDKVNFVLSTPYNMSNGTNRIFTIKGTTAGRADRTVKFYLEYTSDVLLVDQVYNVGAQVTNNYDGNIGFSIVTLQGGNITISYSGPTTGDIMKNGQDQVLVNFAINSASRQTEVKKIEVKLEGIGSNLKSGSTYYLNDIKIRSTNSTYADSGSTMMGPKSLSSSCTSDTECTLIFTDSFFIDGGTTKYLQVTVDAANDSYFDSNNRVYRASIMSWGSSSMRYSDTGEYVSTSDIVPSTTYVGNNQTVKASTLQVSLSGALASDTVVTGQTGVNSVAFTFTTGSSAVTVNSIRVTGYGDDNGAGVFTQGMSGTHYLRDLVSSVRLMYGSTQLGTSQNASNNDGTIVFNNLNWNIPANTGSVVKVVYDTTSTAPYQDFSPFLSDPTATNRVKYDIHDVSADVDATNSEGDTAAATIIDDSNSSTADAGIITTMIGKGQLSVAIDGNTPDSGIILSNTNTVEVAKFKFTATRESVKLKKLGFTIAAAGSDPSAVANVYINAGGSDISANSVDLSATGNNFAKFEGLNIDVPKDGNLVISVKVDLKVMDNGGTYSGKMLQINVNDQIAGVNVLEATGNASNTTITGFDNAAADAGVEATANTMAVRKTKPTITRNSIDNSTLTGGTKSVYKFSVAADSIADLEFARLKLNYTKNGAFTLATWKLYDESATPRVELATGADNGTDTVTFAMAADKIRTIGKGTSRNFNVEVVIGGVIASGNSLDLGLISDTAQVNNVVGSVVYSAVVWSDLSYIPHATATTGDYMNGYLATVPTTRTTLTYNN